VRAKAVGRPRLETLAFSAYTEALLITHQKGLRGDIARETALTAAAKLVSKRSGERIDSLRMLELLSRQNIGVRSSYEAEAGAASNPASGDGNAVEEDDPFKDVGNNLFD